MKFLSCVLMSALAACGGDDDGGAGGADAAALEIDGGEGSSTDASAPDAAGPRPDLILDGSYTEQEWVIDEQTFNEGSCALVEGCIGGLGTRTLLRLPMRTVNQGESDLDLGDPSDGEPWVYSACHDHYHLEDFASYDLVDGEGNTVASTRYQAFCIIDYEPYAEGASPTAVHECTTPGISVGWADVRDGDIPCQWIDITDIAPGDYDVHMTVNDSRVAPESDYDNNTFEMPVTIPE